MTQDELIAVVGKAVDNAIEEITSHYQVAWSTPAEKIERALREDPELNQLIAARRQLELLRRPASPQWRPLKDGEYVFHSEDEETIGYAEQSGTVFDYETHNVNIHIIWPDDIRLCKRRPEVTE